MKYSHMLVTFIFQMARMQVNKRLARMSTNKWNWKKYNHIILKALSMPINAHTRARTQAPAHAISSRWHPLFNALPRVQSEGHLT